MEIGQVAYLGSADSAEVEFRAWEAAGGRQFDGPFDFSLGVSAAK